MKSKIIIFIIVLLVIFQFFGEKTPYQEPTSADLFAVENAPEEVKLLIQKNCYDCHSNQVNYPCLKALQLVQYECITLAFGLISNQ